MVKVYRLLCRNTYEREMFNKASLKLGLDKAILQSMNTSQGKDLNNKQLTKKEIEDLLKKGKFHYFLKIILKITLKTSINLRSIWRCYGRR